MVVEAAAEESVIEGAMVSTKKALLEAALELEAVAARLDRAVDKLEVVSAASSAPSTQEPTFSDFADEERPRKRPRASPDLYQAAVELEAASVRLDNAMDGLEAGRIAGSASTVSALEAACSASVELLARRPIDVRENVLQASTAVVESTDVAEVDTSVPAAVCEEAGAAVQRSLAQGAVAGSERSRPSDTAVLCDQEATQRDGEKSALEFAPLLSETLAKQRLSQIASDASLERESIDAEFQDMIRKDREWTEGLLRGAALLAARTPTGR